MGILFNRLLNLLNEEESGSTYYHIGLIMLEHMEELDQLSISRLAELCDVSKSTISKFIRYLGYEDYSDFRYAAAVKDNKYQIDYIYMPNVMGYVEKNSFDSYMMAIQQDINATYQHLDWEAIDRLVHDLAEHRMVAAFGLMFSETAAMDLQMKLYHMKKFILTNINDVKQEHFIENAGEDTLIIVFSDSGKFLDRYENLPDFANKTVFARTKAKVVLITSNREMAKDPRVAYCIFYEKTREMSTHRILYNIITDIIAYRYRSYILAKGAG